MTDPRHRIAAGPYRAVLSEVGAALHTLAHNGRELLLARDAAIPQPAYRGAVLVPWPNRIADGRYRFNGQQHQLAINEVGRGCALHGLVAWTQFTVTSLRPGGIRLEHTVRAQPGYPFDLHVTVEHAVGPDGLTSMVITQNIGTDAAPYGVAMHPYLRAGAGPVDDWTLELPAARRLEVDPDRLLPLTEQSVDGQQHDFRAGRLIGPQAIDHAYTGIDFHDGLARARLRDRAGRGVEVSWDQTCPFVQVHTADAAPDGLRRAGLAFEPMTCAPNAFSSGNGLFVLEPGAQHRVTWRIAAID